MGPLNLNAVDLKPYYTKQVVSSLSHVFISHILIALFPFRLLYIMIEMKFYCQHCGYNCNWLMMQRETLHLQDASAQKCLQQRQRWFLTSLQQSQLHLDSRAPSGAALRRTARWIRASQFASPRRSLAKWFPTSGTCERHLNCSINCLCAEKQYLKARSGEDVTPAAAII